MQYHKQRFRHQPDKGIYGDCHRTALACLLDMEPEQVPHFGEMMFVHGTEAASEAEELWLNKQGLSQVFVPYSVDTLDNLLLHLASINPRAYYLLGGTSKNGVGHTVVGCGGKLIWDPAQDNSGIVGPMSDGFFWISYFLPVALVRVPTFNQKEGEQECLS